MKKIAAAFILALFHSITAYCQHPYNQNLGGVAFITFPDTPKSNMISSEKFHICDYNKSRYIAMATSLTPDSGDLVIGDNFDSLYNSFLYGVIKKIKGPIIYKGKISINNLNGFEFGYKTIIDGRTYFSYQRLLYLNDILINYSILSSDSLQKNDKKINAFFKTFKITNDGHLKNAAKWGRITGNFIVGIIGIGLVALISFGLFSAFKKLT